MKKRIIIGAIVLVLIVAGVVWMQQRFGIGKEEKTTGPIAHVQVAKLERKTITEKVIVYGSVVAQPGKTHSVSIAFETRVRHILVAPGQFVQENDPLIEIELSPGAQVQFQQAKNAAEAARKELKQTQERFNLKLATNQDLSAAEKTARDAEAQLTALQRAGAGGDNRIHSDISGVIAKVDAQDGQIVPPGGPLVEIVAENEIEVKLGVEPEDLSAAQQGALITIFPVNDPTAAQVEGSIRLVTRRIDPTTRLVDVYVALPEGTKLLLDQYVRGEIQRVEGNALVVRRSAVLPNESREFRVFTVAHNRAVMHTVKIGAENPREMQVIADDLHPGDLVVTVGNYELEDGMAVEIKK
ncbi:MAG: efflux RND transporter periplasmic adaptor subunit [Verrucomicrobia bacterium]|nr:MAG: efflux RND transporter periplasmic adaptor subunit [Verrucomicrobiota bacterium]